MRKEDTARVSACIIEIAKQPWHGCIDTVNLFSYIPNNNKTSEASTLERERKITLVVGTGWYKSLFKLKKKPIPGEFNK